MQASINSTAVEEVGERDEAYRAMRARSAELEEQVAACITRSWQGAESTLLDIARIGSWYLCMQHYGWMQCCVFRIYYRDASGEERSHLREYGILARGGRPQLVVLDA